jgi:hypothetical protein
MKYYLNEGNLMKIDVDLNVFENIVIPCEVVLKRSPRKKVSQFWRIGTSSWIKGSASPNSIYCQS